MKNVRLLALALSIAACSSAASAQNYPAKPIRLIAPFPPGGSTDLLARVVAQKLTDAWGQQVIVENRGGAGGTIGVELAARAAPDGYTIVMGHIGTFGANPTLYPKLPYDAIKDFAPITLLAMVPNGMVVHPTLPVRSVKDLLAVARAKLGNVLYGSGGSGSAAHLAMVYFELLAKVKLTHVPYKGTGPAIYDLIAGQTSTMITGMAALMPHIKSQRLRIIGVGTAKRLAVLPEVPTISEAGVPGYEAVIWLGLMAPKGTPPAIVSRLNAEITKIQNRSEVRQEWESQGALPMPMTPDEFSRYLNDDIVKWERIVKISGAKPDQ